MTKYICGATMDIGAERESQEDYVRYKELGPHLFCVIADGTGSQEGYAQPATIVTMEIIDSVTKTYDEKPDLFFQDPEFFIKMGMDEANRILAAFKMGNEEKYCGYAASVTCALFTSDQKIYAGHTGNTRLYVLRNGRLQQLTQDQTKAAELLNEGKIDIETYHVHPDRLKITGGLGMISAPQIQTFHGKLKDDDLILMTTDGIHYAIQPEPMAQIVLDSTDGIAATKNLVDAAKNVIKYPDNMSAMLIYKEK